jgi:hypothetical protein
VHKLCFKFICFIHLFQRFMIKVVKKRWRVNRDMNDMNKSILWPAELCEMVFVFCMAP